MNCSQKTNDISFIYDKSNVCEIAVFRGAGGGRKRASALSLSFERK